MIVTQILVHIVAYLLKARLVEIEKQSLPRNGCVICSNGVTVGSGAFSVVHIDVI
jgi:hypothetical protein